MLRLKSSQIKQISRSQQLRYAGGGPQFHEPTGHLFAEKVCSEYLIVYTIDALLATSYWPEEKVGELGTYLLLWFLRRHGWSRCCILLQTRHKVGVLINNYIIL